MSTILDQIRETKKAEIQRLKSTRNLSDFQAMPLFKKPTVSLNQSIRSSGFGLIAELKRKSPSAGQLVPDETYQECKMTYVQSNEIAGISCLTDSTYFGGTCEDLAELAAYTNKPILRKEFILDELQLFEAKAYGADAVLLIAELLEKEEILHFTIIAQSLGLEVILELHHAREFSKINDLVDIIGINNRDLSKQQTDLTTSFLLAPYLPSNKTLISESGIRHADEILHLRAKGFHGALVGESILRNHGDFSFLSPLIPTTYAH